ncbi:adenylosuccinate synthase [Candidatus Fermentibacterales bacterium]|nr:adenylosuccinate synthase [Candidatus Fermentibacterales bacterium]
MPVDVLTGLQWGDEGKGKIVDILSESVDAVARFSGGGNAGHTVSVGPDLSFVLHHLPTGLLRENVEGLIGSGCVIDPGALLGEMGELAGAGLPVDRGRLLISAGAHLVHPVYRVVEKWDEARRGDSSIGTTARGIGPCYAEKYWRRGIRLEDAAFEQGLRHKAREQLEYHLDAMGGSAPSGSDLSALRDATGRFVEASLALLDYAGDVSLRIADILESGGSVLAEGAQGALLDPDHGTYPYVTGGSCTAGGACSGLGIGPRSIGQVVGVMKAYSTRVGAGPFPTELPNETGDRIRERGGEYGATTGRPRRCGWLDGVLARYAVRLNGCSWVALTLLDVLSGFEKLRVCNRYELDPEASAGIFERGARMALHRPFYRELDGWEEEIRGMTSWDALPRKARDYVLYLEELIGVPIGLVSTGPGRSEIIRRDV